MPTISINNQTEDHKNNDRQHRLHVSYQQTGQSEVSIPVYRSTKIVELVHPTWHQHLCHMPTWTPEHHSRLTEQEVLTRRLVGDRHKTHTAHIRPLGIPRHRSLCHTQKCQMPTHLLKSRSGLPVSGGRPPHYKGCTSPLYLSTLLPTTQSASQDTSGMSQSHSHSPNMAMTHMVSLPLTHGSLSTNHPAVDSTSPLTGCRSNCPSKSKTSPSEGMAPSWFQYTERVCSQKVKENIVISSHSTHATLTYINGKDSGLGAIPTMSQQRTIHSRLCSRT